MTVILFCGCRRV